MTNPSGVSYINQVSASSHLSAEASSRIQKIQQLCCKRLSELCQNMFDGIDDSFFELANNARTNNEQNVFFEAMREIRIKRKSVETEFNKKLSNSFETSHVLKTIQTNTSKEIDFESLSLINKDDMEQRVAINSMSNKATANFQGPLLQFHTRIANLYGSNDLSRITPPLRPEDLSAFFSEACEKFEINLKERLIVFKQFDRFVLSNLNYVLDEINQLLIRAGILPNFKSEVIKNKSPINSGKLDNLANQYSQPNKSQIDDYNTNKQSVLPELQTLLANIRHQNRNTLSNHSLANESLHTRSKLIETQDLINLLTAIQNSAQINQNPQNAKVVNIQSHLKSHFNANPSSNDDKPTLKQLDEDIINIVAMLFEFILEDYNLAPSMQVLISRLQIPILKVAINDSNFFNTNKHPARKLLNSLAKAGISWSDNPSSTQDSLFIKMQEIVNTILTNFDGDISLFTSLNKDLDDFMLKEEKKSKIVEQRTKESEKGLLKSRQAQQAVDNFLNQIVENETDLPEIIHETLLQGWSRVMFLAYLKDENEHQWLKMCQAAHDLVWCLKPIFSQADRQNWIAIAPKLLKTLKNGLQDVSFHSHNLDETITEIRTLLTSRFKQNTFDDETNSSTYQTASKLINNQSPSAVEKQLATSNSLYANNLQIIEDLQPGTWFEFKLNSNKKIRCKLSTIIEEADTFIFVNRLGLKTLERTKEDLANDLQKKNAIILEQALLLDRAMNAVTSSLKQKANA